MQTKQRTLLRSSLLIVLPFPFLFKGKSPDTIYFWAANSKRDFFGFARPTWKMAPKPPCGHQFFLLSSKRLLKARQASFFNTISNYAYAWHWTLSFVLTHAPMPFSDTTVSSRPLLVTNSSNQFGRIINRFARG